MKPWLLPLVLFLFFTYLGLDYYAFEFNADSTLNQKRKNRQELEKKITDEKMALQKMVQDSQTQSEKSKQYSALKEAVQKEQGKLPRTLSTPQLMQTTLEEAKKKGLSIVSLKPTGDEKWDHHIEHTFEMEWHGLFPQIFQFLSSLEGLPTQLRVSGFSAQVAQFKTEHPQLEGRLEIKYYEISNTENHTTLERRSLASESSEGTAP